MILIFFMFPGSGALKTSLNSWSLNTVLIPLMSAGLLVNLAGAMFAVAVPSIRAEFLLNADDTSWILIAHNLPFIACIPLYGKLSEIFGKKPLLFAGLVCYTIGSVLMLTARSFPVVITARIIQGTGGAGIIPLAIAMIPELSQSEDHGKTLGSWNSMGPVSGLIGPFIAGVIITSLRWQSIMWIIAGIGIISIVLLQIFVPAQKTQSNYSAKQVLKTFDWFGAFLFNLLVVSIVFYTSSRPITGRAPLTDYRLLAAVLVLLLLFVRRQRSTANPYINLGILRNRNLRCASLAVSTRMMAISGMMFIIPLLVTDLYGFTPALTGLVLAVHSAAMLATMRLGGTIIDRCKKPAPVVLGLLMQASAMLLFFLIPSSVSVVVLFAVISLHGFGAGLSIAALHLYAAASVPAEQSGSAVGMYSMIRFSGRLFGSALGGIILYWGIESYGITDQAYMPVFLFYCIMCALGAVSASGLKYRMLYSSETEKTQTDGIE